MRAFEPQVVVTYDENGFYGHPDHIQTNRVTRAAMADCGIPAKLYYTAFARSSLSGFREILAEAGIEGPDEVEENPDFGTPDELITTKIDCSAVAGRKYASLAAHASQSDNIFFLQMGEELFASIMGSESFVRVADSTHAPVPEDDLFAGLALRQKPEPGLRPPGEGTRGPVRAGSLRRGAGRGRAGASVGNRADEPEHRGDHIGARRERPGSGPTASGAPAYEAPRDGPVGGCRERQWSRGGIRGGAGPGLTGPG